MNSYFNEPKKCQVCEKQISCFEFKIEYGNHFYHKECFKCKCCYRFFSMIDNYDNVNLIPLQDDLGNLYCHQDFISTLKCSLCQSVFDRKSLTYKLLDNNDKEHLVHVECASCNICKSNLDFSNKYYLETNNLDDQKVHLYCRCCRLNKSTNSKNHMLPKKNKKVMSVHQRLSTRQKELLINKLININDQIQNDEAKKLIENLALEIGCSRKSLIYYVEKHLKKECNESVPISMNTKTNSITLIIEELNKLDKILAPNKFPFGQYNRKLPIKENNNIIS